MADRPYDLLLLGATGFAGALTADYLARRAPESLRWAIAGRNRDKLEIERAKLATVRPDLSSLPLVEVDVSDESSVRAAAESTRAVATTVGPYVEYGEPVVAACAAAGTDYLDLTGEPEFVDTMFLRYHDQARESGARIVHACGFDSIPHDLGAYFTVLQLPEDVPLTLRGYVQAGAAVSGGTLASLLLGLSRGRATMDAARRRREIEQPPGTRRARAVSGRPHRTEATGGWALPFPSLDPQIVARSARAVERYGPDFMYTHYISVSHLTTAAGLVGGFAGLAAAAQVPPVRAAVLRRLPQGEGPSPERRARSWFRVTFVGEGGGRRVVTRVSGGDPGYDETAKMLAEAAMCLVQDDLPVTSGQVTTVQAMGGALLDRLQRAGLRFEVCD